MSAKLPESLILGMLDHEWPVHAVLDPAQALRWVANCNDRDRPRLWLVDLTNLRMLRVVPPVEARLEEVPDGG